MCKSKDQSQNKIRRTANARKTQSKWKNKASTEKGSFYFISGYFAVRDSFAHRDSRMKQIPYLTQPLTQEIAGHFDEGD